MAYTWLHGHRDRDWRYNNAGSTTFALNSNGDTATLRSIDVNGTVRWQLVHQSGSTAALEEKLNLYPSAPPQLRPAGS